MEYKIFYLDKLFIFLHYLYLFLQEKIKLCVSSNHQHIVELCFSALFFSLLQCKIKLFFLQFYLHHSHLFHDIGQSFSPCIICIFCLNKTLLLFISLGSLRSSSKIIWFSSFIFCISLKVFYQIDCLGFFFYLLFGLGSFLPNQPTQLFY